MPQQEGAGNGVIQRMIPIPEPAPGTRAMGMARLEADLLEILADGRLLNASDRHCNERYQRVPGVLWVG